MRRLILIVPIFLTLVIGTTIKTTKAENVDIGISIRDDRIRSFYLAIGDYYRIKTIPPRYTVLHEEELPLLILISQYARVSPDVIVEMRRIGFSWYEIMIRYRVYPEVVFREYIAYYYGPPYGKALGHKKHKKKIKFKDRDLVELANIKFISEYYGERPYVVIEQRERYPNYIELNYVYYKEYKERKGKKHKRWD